MSSAMYTGSSGVPGADRVGESVQRQSVFTLVMLMVLVVLVVLVTLQVELLLSLVVTGSSQLTSNDLITVETFLIKHRHV